MDVLSVGGGRGEFLILKGKARPRHGCVRLWLTSPSAIWRHTSDSSARWTATAGPHPRDPILSGVQGHAQPQPARVPKQTPEILFSAYAYRYLSCTVLTLVQRGLPAQHHRERRVPYTTTMRGGTSAGELRALLLFVVFFAPAKREMWRANRTRSLFVFGSPHFSLRRATRQFTKSSFIR